MSLRFDRCRDCGDIHLTCGICGAKRSLVRECDYLKGDWYILDEDMAIGVLKLRAEFSGLDCFICDRCWPAVRETNIPKVDPNGYVKPPPRLFIMGTYGPRHRAPR